MGSTVLDAGVPLQAGLHVYAHCQKGMPGGVSLLVINTDRSASHALMLADVAQRYTLDAVDLSRTEIRLNGGTLGLDASGALPTIEGVAAAADLARFDPATITFLTVPAAANNACRHAA